MASLRVENRATPLAPCTCPCTQLRKQPNSKIFAILKKLPTHFSIKNKDRNKKIAGSCCGNCQSTGVILQDWSVTEKDAWSELWRPMSSLLMWAQLKEKAGSLLRCVTDECGCFKHSHLSHCCFALNLQWFFIYAWSCKLCCMWYMIWYIICPCWGMYKNVWT